MIPILWITAAIIGAAAAIGITAVFWEDVKQFLKETLEEVKQLASRFIQGCKVFLRKIKKGALSVIKVISAYYIKQNQNWERICYQEVLEESQVPPQLLEHASYDHDLDITEELKMELM